jgi:N-acetylmuramoyl-L-alanine amidase
LIDAIRGHLKVQRQAITGFSAGVVLAVVLATTMFWPEAEIVEVENIRVVRIVHEVEVPIVGERGFTETDLQYLAVTMWGEARGEGIDGMRAVGHVILNRAESASYDNSVRAVVMRPWQFSVWNTGDPTRPRLERLINGWQPVGRDGEMWLIAQAIAREILENRSTDPTNGAVYYHADYVSPNWSRNAIGSQIGGHVFYTSLGQ